jgi:hypothetical protein
VGTHARNVLTAEMLDSHLIDPERTWGKPRDGGCWAELRKCGCRPESLLVPFSKTVADIASGAVPLKPPDGREDELALALASHAGITDSKYAALATSETRHRTHAIAAALLQRLAGAYAALDRVDERREVRRTKRTCQHTPDPRDVVAELTDDAVAFLWRMYASSHLDLAVEIGRTRDAAAFSDAALSTRPRAGWPSRYELMYPWGTRCVWAGYTPKMSTAVQGMPWLGRTSTNKRRPLCHVIQKAFPGKGLSRKWGKVIADYCSDGGEVAHITAAILGFSLFGGYANVGAGFPVPIVALQLWRDLTEDPVAFAQREAVQHPKVVLSAWQEHLSWILGVLEPLQSVVAADCDLEVFSGEVSERADDCVRTALCHGIAAPADGSAVTTGSRATPPTSAAEALAAAEEAARRSYAQALCGVRRPTNRPTFTALFVRAVNTRIRNKEAAAASVPPGTGTAPRDLERRALRPIGGCTIAAMASAASVVAPWKWSIRGFQDAMDLADLPPHIQRTVIWLSDMYAQRTLTDDAVKSSLNKVLNAAECPALQTARACMASVAFSDAIAVLPLSAATLAGQLKVVEPERRFAFVCPSHWIIGATYVAAPRPGATAAVHRCLKFVSYGMGSDSLLCNKQIKAPRSSARSQQREAAAAAADPRSKTSCGVRMITIPTIGVAIRIKNAIYASCEVCGMYAKLDPGRWCVDGKIVCPLHFDVGPAVAAAAPTEDPPAGPVKTPCVICRSRWRSIEPTGSRLRVRTLATEGNKYSIAVITCCARHIRVVVDQPISVASDRLTNLPRLLTMASLRKAYLEAACAQDAMRHPYSGGRATSLRAYLNASSLHAMVTGDPAPKDAGNTKKRTPKKPPVPTSASFVDLPAPPPPPPDVVARWDGRSSAMLDETVNRLAALCFAHADKSTKQD